MANIYKDSDKRKKVVPGGGQKPQEETKAEEVVTAPAEPESVQEATQEAPAEPVAKVETPEEEKQPVSEEVEPPAPAANLLADLIPQKKKPKPETYGFYLDSDVHDELVKLAKANKTNKSRFLNALLRRVLFNE